MYRNPQHRHCSGDGDAGARWDIGSNSRFDAGEASAGALEALFPPPPHADCSLVNTGLALQALLVSAIIPNVSCVNDRR